MMIIIGAAPRQRVRPAALGRGTNGNTNSPFYRKYIRVLFIR